MAYDKHIDRTEEDLRELRDVYEQDNIDRFTDGLESGKIDSEEQIIEFTNTIRTNDGLTRLEYSRLQRLKVGFIESFATNYNKRFSTVHLLTNRMRSSISRGLKMLEDFCEKKRRKGHPKSKRKVVRNSKMGKGEYQPSLWGLEPYKESVKELYKEVSNYSIDLTKCIDLCLEIIRKVNYIRTHPDEAEKIYDKCHKDTVINNRTAIRRFIKLNVNMENDILKKMEDWERKKKALKNLKAKLYHTLDENEWNDLCICEEVMLARQQGITNQERALWGENKQQVMRVRVVFEHLDEINPGGKSDHIGGKFMARLYYWSDILPNRGVESWYTYFYDSYILHGKLIPRKVGSIKMEKRKIAKLDHQLNKDEQKEFDQKLEKLIQKYMVEPTELDFIGDEAVNF